MEVRVIKDCWVEDRPGKQVEHDIVTEIKKSMDDQTFREYFIDICGYRKTDTSGGFDSVCKILEKRTFMPREKFEPQYLVPASVNPKPIYADSARDSIADQDHRLQPSSTKRAPNNPPHPRLRYQVVYEEKGISLFEVTSFAEVFLHIGRATEGLHHLHQAGWVHKDFSPGNVIVVDGKAKISDLEFAKRRAVSQLGELTRPRDPSLLGTRELRTGTLLFIAVEVEEGDYLFRPDPPSKEDSEADEDLNWELPIPRNQKGGDQRTEPPKGDNDVISAMELIERIFLHNPLHDYESVWWIAVWFVFHCKPEGVADEVMEQARDKLYQNRTATFGLNAFEGARKSLPKVLQPLCDVLVVMRKLLVEAYKSFEESFDGSGMLSVARKLMRQVRGLAVLSRDLTVKPPVVHQKLNTESDVKQFVTLGAEQDQLVGEQDIGAGGQPMDTDDPFIDTPAQDPVLGKRKRDSGLRSEVNPALERKLIKDDQTVQP
ncbi:hypothetical protein BDM02DRAFT_3270848 [Thelephora ganbajun]|uniref:Uncharacterized protein n=1 Tax=Thelephora ganbajun TaxID=370292 RepID=A0ACB6ZAM8_THEGA|nr:hypothetical protein BDM02DRAFT_3270848 [Thelephora ganbajun]